MIIKTANFTGSFISVDKCPDSDWPEFAFVGRSNVGKSSLINMLCNSKSLVKVSTTPGKTQTINFFNINDTVYLVDLPGVGYAKAGKSQLLLLKKMIEGYLQRRKQLRCTFMLVDSGLEPQKIDLDLANRLGSWNVPFAIVFTKTDKLTKNELHRNLMRFQNAIFECWNHMPHIFITSSKKKKGKDELWQFIDSNI